MEEIEGKKSTKSFFIAIFWFWCDRALSTNETPFRKPVACRAMGNRFRRRRRIRLCIFFRSSFNALIWRGIPFFFWDRKLIVWLVNRSQRFNFYVKSAHQLLKPFSRVQQFAELIPQPFFEPLKHRFISPKKPQLMKSAEVSSCTFLNWLCNTQSIRKFLQITDDSRATKHRPG